MKKTDFEKTLTKRQIERQDFVDNGVFDLIQKLLPARKRLAWDIEAIGAVRDVIEGEVVKRGLMSEGQFYPYVKT